MTDVTLPGAAIVPTRASRHRRVERLSANDAIFHWLTLSAAVTVLVVLAGIIVALFDGSLPALRAFGAGFFTTQSWNPVTERFGALAPIVGTLLTSLIAMLIGVPVSILMAIFLTELCPPILRRPIGIAIELLAGIPSIIYGIWGFFVFAPFLQQTLQPFLISAFLIHAPG